MDSATIRRKFLEFFESKGHQIVPSAPLVLKNDPSLLFTNSGMVQFKDFFLGNSVSKYKRIADTQKCLRVSGKHNDLEDVGLDTYHHTMFEMLGNWSFGDYFKKEAISWAWELLTEEYNLPKERLYVSVYGGDQDDSQPLDKEAFDLWRNFVDEDRIILGNKKDNFWEMADVGPCGPCSEIHIDLRSANEIEIRPGKELVNNDHPQVVEIWNLVFMEFERTWKTSTGSSELVKFDLGFGNKDKKAREKFRSELTILKPLPQKNVDTGMGFERLCMAIQAKESNYDTDVFKPLIDFIATNANVTYGLNKKTDVAIRVMSDHIRAVSFAIADGQLPSSGGAGYVIRRILRRAVRYGYSNLKFREPFIYRLVPLLALQFKDVFPELHKQEEYVSKAILAEEKSFLRTLEDGIFLFDQNLLRLVEKNLERFLENRKIKFSRLNNEELFPNFYFEDAKIILELSLRQSKNDVDNGIWKSPKMIQDIPNSTKSLQVDPYFLLTDEFWQDPDVKRLFPIPISLKGEVDGKTAFILNDTHGFPIDLTQLMAREIGFSVDMDGYNALLNEQRQRSKVDASKETGDWISVGRNASKITSEDGRRYHTTLAFPNPEVYLNEWKFPNKGFVGYKRLSAVVRILKYRIIKTKNKELLQVVLNKTPFYAESGGQVGDVGYLEAANGDCVKVLDTKKENDLIIHYVDRIPDFDFLAERFLAVVDGVRRRAIKRNHSATHLLQAALRTILGKHVEQKGSLVNEKLLRFDFSHFSPLTTEEIREIEILVNRKIRRDILREIKVLPIEQARNMGAMALFGEKYGDRVRVVTFDPEFSIELCGGTHVLRTGKIGLFKITSESSVASGVRRIEAVTGEEALNQVNESLAKLNEVIHLLRNPKDLAASLQTLIEEKHSLEKKLEAFNQQLTNQIKEQLALKAIKSNGHTLILEKVSLPNADALKNIAYGLRNQFDDLLMVLAAEIDSKPQVAVMIGEKLEASKKFHAGNMVKELAKEIDGGGGGQPFYATAGGKNLSGLDAVILKAKEIIG